MKIEILKTTELSDQLWEEILEGYNDSFPHHETIKSLKEGFCGCNKLGFSYHCFAYSEENALMGYTEFTPTFYKGGLKICVGGRTFIRKEYRSDFMLFAKIVNALKKRCADDGCQAVIAVPNHNSRDYAIRINRFVYVADLNYYILPLAPSKFLHKRSLHLIDGLAKFFCAGWLYTNILCSLIYNSKAKEKPYQLETDDDFYKARFKHDVYIQYREGDFYCCYRHYDEDGADAVYLMDFRQNGIRTMKALNFAIKKIMRHDHADAILFVGFMGLKQASLFKVPRRFVPKPLPFTYYVIDKNDKELKSAMTSKDAWDFSLMNFDVR